MDPRTFLPPRSLPLARVPELGDQMPSLPVTPQPGRPAIVAFLRHTGCPFAEETMRMVRTSAAGAADVQWIVISHAPADATDRWCRAVGGAAGIQLVSDPQRSAYAAWGLGRTSLAHFLGRRSLTEVARLARRGIRNRHPHGTRWQAAGTFALDDDAVVRWRHLPEHAGDLPNLNDALAAIR
jgi:hypothetical protein